MVSAIPLLQPVVALLCWSGVMWLWLYVARIPAMKAMGIKLDPNVPPGALFTSLPPRARWKGDNYNHLMEQPTLFYAVALVLALVDPGNATAITAAWAYTLIRVAHSLWQSLINIIEVRFALFVLSSIALATMIWQAAKAVFAVA